jgi:hypothetical protein
MPNLDLDKKDVVISDDRVKKYLGKDKLTGNNLTTTISRLENDGNDSDEKTYALKYLKGLVGKERDKIDGAKRITMKTDGVGKKKGGNAFKDTHEKDRDNANPTQVGGLAKLTSSGEHSKVSDQIENNRVTYYESIDSEIENIRYLIEYMNNNNKIIKS